MRGKLVRAEIKHQCEPPGIFVRLFNSIEPGDKWQCDICCKWHVFGLSDHGGWYWYPTTPPESSK